MKQEIIKPVGKWGNSGGILVPREWAGKEAKVILIDRTGEIRKEIFDMLGDDLEDIIGIYLVGSYARGEEHKDKSDIDIIAISNNTRKSIVSGRYEISIAPFEGLKKTAKSNPILVLPRLREAKVILNKELLEEFKKIKITKKDFKWFIDDTKILLKINHESLYMDEEDKYTDDSTIYSLILRARGLMLMKCLLYGKQYSNKEFLKWLKGVVGKDSEKIYDIYRAVKNDKKVRSKIDIDVGRKLLKEIKKEIKKYG